MSRLSPCRHEFLFPADGPDFISSMIATAQRFPTPPDRTPINCLFTKTSTHGRNYIRRTTRRDSLAILNNSVFRPLSDEASKMLPSPRRQFQFTEQTLQVCVIGSGVCVVVGEKAIDIDCRMRVKPTQFCLQAVVLRLLAVFLQSLLILSTHHRIAYSTRVYGRGILNCSRWRWGDALLRKIVGVELWIQTSVNSS